MRLLKNWQEQNGTITEQYEVDTYDQLTYQACGRGRLIVTWVPEGNKQPVPIVRAEPHQPAAYQAAESRWPHPGMSSIVETIEEAREKISEATAVPRELLFGEVAEILPESFQALGRALAELDAQMKDLPTPLSFHPRPRTYAADGSSYTED